MHYFKKIKTAIQHSLIVLYATSIPDDCFFQFGILSNFSVFWLNDVVAVSYMYFGGTSLVLQVGVLQFVYYIAKHFS